MITYFTFFLQYDWKLIFVSHLPDYFQMIPLAKSSSLTDLKGLEPQSEFLQSAIDALEEHRQEQAQIENQIQALMAKSLKRREQFRAVWGVSPRSINQKRDLKTVINVQNVKFSGFKEENGEENVENVEENVENVEENVESGNEEEKTINTDVFQQLIDANFPSNDNFEASNIHNFTGIELFNHGKYIF